MATSVPQVLDNGRYQIERVLGVGGMAVVLLALDTRIQTYRAIKLVHTEYARSAQARARFKTEAYAQAGLRHPNILMVHDVIEDDAGIYLVMELADGGSLAQKVQQHGPLAPREVARIGATVARALSDAHEHGVVHRDIKPDNILIDQRGILKLADFGIARLTAREVVLTQTGMVMGTWAFMPPEQRESARHVDARADLYALGVTLYYLLTGQKSASLHNREAYAQAFAGVPPALAATIQRATRFDPEDRHPDAATLAADLEQIGPELGTEPIFSRQEPPTEVTPDDVESAPTVASQPPVSRAAVTQPPVSQVGVSQPTISQPPASHSTVSRSTEAPPKRPLLLPLLAAALAAAAVVAVGGGGLVLWLRDRAAVEPAEPEQDPASQTAIADPPPEALAAAPLPSPGPEALLQTAPAPAGQDAPPEPAPSEIEPAPPRPETPPDPGEPKQASPRIITVVTPGSEPTPAADTPAPEAARPATGTVLLRTVPSGARVSKGGQALSRAGSGGYALPAGNHILDVQSEAGERTRIPVFVRAGEVVEICYSFDTNSACAP